MPVPLSIVRVCSGAASPFLSQIGCAGGAGPVLFETSHTCVALPGACRRARALAGCCGSCCCLHVFPGFPVDNSAYCRLIHAKLGRLSALRDARSSRPTNLQHFSVCQFRATVSWSACYPPFAHGVSDVVGLACEEQMRRADTASHVAAVANIPAFWNSPKRQHIGKAVGPPNTSFKSETAVPVPIPTGTPLPAAGAFPDLCPKSLHDFSPSCQ